LPNGSILEEVRNGQGAYVNGLNFEVNYSPAPAYRLQLGGTAQQTHYEEEQVLYEPAGDANHEAITTDEFTRTPRLYGFFTSLWQINRAVSLDVTGTFTGPMIVPRVIDADGRIELRNSPSFLDANFKLSYDWHLGDAFEIQFSTGIRNFLNSFQDDFDTGPTRDSDYVYGPLNPRTYFISIVFGNTH
jgi:outer membrane receptor for ferrienterochelin and colicins